VFAVVNAEKRAVLDQCRDVDVAVRRKKVVRAAGRNMLERGSRTNSKIMSYVFVIHRFKFRNRPIALFPALGPAWINQRALNSAFQITRGFESLARGAEIGMMLSAISSLID
jgi:hypothetical protein